MENFLFLCFEIVYLFMVVWFGIDRMLVFVVCMMIVLFNGCVEERKRKRRKKCSENFF